MKLFVLLSDHDNVELTDGFLQSISGLELLFEIYRTDFEIELFKQYNNNEITPIECLRRYQKVRTFPEVLETEYVILKAKEYDIKITPVGPCNISLFSDDFVNNFNKNILENILKLLPAKNAGLLIGYKHEAILDHIPRELIIYNKPASVRAN